MSVVKALQNSTRKLPNYMKMEDIQNIIYCDYVKESNKYFSGHISSSLDKSFEKQSEKLKDIIYKDFISYKKSSINKLLNAKYVTDSSASLEIDNIEDSVSIVANKYSESDTRKLLSLMYTDVFESGMIPKSEQYVKEVIEDIGFNKTLDWLMNIYTDNYCDSHILCGLMHILSHFDYHEVKPDGIVMALGLLQHRDNSVRDFAVKAIENWNSKEAIPILKALSCDAKWLQDYINLVIEDLENGGD